MPKADHANAYKQLPLPEADELVAAPSPRNPGGYLWFGLLPKTQLFGSTAAARRYICLSRDIATLACCFPRILCADYYDDFGLVVPRPLVHAAPSPLAGFNKLPGISLKKEKSEAEPTSEFQGLTISLRDDSPGAIAILSPFPGRIQKLTKLVMEMREEEDVSVDSSRKPAGKLGFAHTGRRAG